MSSKNRSQIRLQQITGSLTSIKSSLPSTVSQGTAVDSLSESAIPDLESILEYYAKAIQNIHGNQEFGANQPGQFEYSSGLGIKALKPSVDSKIVLGNASVTGSPVSGLAASNLTGATLSESDTSIALDGSNSATLSKGSYLIFTAGSSEMVFRLTADLAAAASSVAVLYMPEMSSSTSISVSGITAINQTSGAFTGVQFLNVRTDRVESDAGLEIAARASSDVILSDGVLTLDLNGTDAVDGLLVDAEGTITFEAAHNSDGAIIANAGGSAGVIRLQNQGTDKLLVSGSEVRVTNQLRVIDATDSSSTTTGAVQVTGGIGVGGKAFIGGDLDGAGDVTFDKSNVAISIGASAHQLAETSSGLSLSAVGSSKKLALATAGDDITLSAVGGASQIVLSGAQGIEFQTSKADFSYAGTKYAGVTGLLLEKDANEAGTFQSNFSTSTSLLGAINSLASSITAAEPTLFSASIGAAGVSEAASAGVLLEKQEGDVTQFTASVKRNALDVYVNGQLMHSGSETDRAAGTADYNVHPSTPNRIRFAFDLVADDVVTAIDRS